MNKTIEPASITKSSSSTTYDVSRQPNSKLERGYELVNAKSTSTKPSLSTVNTSSVDKNLQSSANKAATANFVDGTKAVIDNLSKIPQSIDKNFYESLRKL